MRSLTSFGGFYSRFSYCDTPKRASRLYINGLLPTVEGKIDLLTGINFLYVIIALAPGGFETMVAMSAFVGADPAYVAIHHIARIFFLSALVPIALARKLNR